MKCPHCSIEFHPELKKIEINSFSESSFDGEMSYIAERRYYVNSMICPNISCHKIIIYLIEVFSDGFSPMPEYTENLIYPYGTFRISCPPEVDDKELVEDYEEACKVLDLSPKASAALSRRCLQHLLRIKAQTTQKDLSKQIDEVLQSGKLPSHLSDSIDAIRNIGNFAAHPLKVQSTGNILPVEVGEAEWNLNILEQLFDFYYVQPAKTLKKKQELNKKLQAAGKPPMK